MAQFPSDPDSRIEQIHAGFSIEYRPDGIIVYHAYTTTRETVDAWFDVTTRHDREYAESGRHLRRIIHMHGTILPTPYTLARVREADSLTPSDLRESAAVIVDHILTYRLLAIFLNRLSGHAQSLIRVFHDADTALAWLDQRFQELGE